ncbi:hypothetical protein [Streptomyces millisiae]|uniref:Uncharacterized protein n=1 Tax=Streptomyces millisiae TaxID=3075542 RepID=A0ABU2LU94_9ACTN|nr:hypothetical protein [Streptomyces sp. DSM 44918]MDT0321175.1 hypothetical protein [Streptomyces sp. DSM 44918]
MTSPVTLGDFVVDARHGEALPKVLFPFLLPFDRWLAGPGAGLLEEALRSTGTGIALR